MGSWFSNISIRKNKNITLDDVAGYILKMASAQQYCQVSSEEEADGAFAIISDENAQWFTVCSDLLSLEDPKSFEKIAYPMSAEFHTDVLEIACFDSDYLYLNLVNAEDKTDAWIGVGSAAGLGIKRRSGLVAWKKKVCDFPVFSECAKKKYIFAEEFLTNVAPCLELPAVQSTVSYEYLTDLGLDKDARYIYFKLPDDGKAKEPPKLEPFMFSGSPCFLGKYSVVSGLNVGGESRGLSVFFVGPYVEHDEITFSDVCFLTGKVNKRKSSPFELRKVQLADGQWAYYYHDPGFRIPPKVKDGLSLSKQLNESFERSISVRFMPHGNPRKILDITVALVPDKSPEGQTVWNVWYPHGSKRAFIEEYNRRWATLIFPGATLDPNMSLREEDYD